MKRSGQNRSAAARRGAVLIFCAAFMMIFLILAAFSIDTAYMQLVQTQMRAATDAASKAATSSLVQGNSSAVAQQAAINYAALNTVAGKTFKLTSGDITFGQSTQQNDGTWLFTAGLTPSRAAQVVGKLNSTNSNGALALFFAPIIGVNNIVLSNTSVASAFACDVCLCLDRSGSMKFDTSGVDWSYPPPYQNNWQNGYNNPPVNGSRWWALDGAVQTFAGILATANAPPNLAVVTWSDDNIINLNLQSSTTAAYNAVHAYTSQNFGGGTNMSGGLGDGVTALTNSSSRAYAKKIMILMSDGDWNGGTDPVAYATSYCVPNNITVHTISFLASGTGTTVLQNIASATGGKSYAVTSSAALTAAWQDIAYSLPVVLTK